MSAGAQPHPAQVMAREMATLSEIIRRAVASVMPQSGRPVSLNVEIYIRDNVPEQIKVTQIHSSHATARVA